MSLRKGNSRETSDVLMGRPKGLLKHSKDLGDDFAFCDIAKVLEVLNERYLWTVKG